jgi:hypothetical protein
MLTALSSLDLGSQPIVSLQPLRAFTSSEASVNLAISLRTRFHQTGDITLLDEAVVLGRQALSLQSQGSPGRARACSELATSLQAVFNQSGGMTILDEAIKLGEEALQLHTLGHTNRARACGDLSVLLQARYDVTGDSACLDEAIQLARQALALRPVGDPQRPSALRNLAGSLKTSSQPRQPELMEEVSILHHEALQVQPRGHPDRWHSLLAQAEFCLEGGDALQAIQSLDEALTTASRAMPQMLRSIIPILQQIQSHGVSEDVSLRLLEVYHTAIDLLSALAGFAVDHSMQLRHLSDYRALGPAAFACAIRANDPNTALQLLERTRGVILSQALQIRDPQLANLPFPLADQLAILLSAMTGGGEAPETLDPLAVSFSTTRDIQHYQYSRLQRLLDEIRSIPGYRDFMRGPPVETLMHTAEHGPVVVLIAEDNRSHAIVISAPSEPPTRVCLPDVSTDMIQSLRFSWSPYSMRGPANSDNDEFDRGMSIKRSSRAHSMLAKVWRLVVKPILCALNISVSGSPRKAFFVLADSPSAKCGIMSVAYPLVPDGTFRLRSHPCSWRIRGTRTGVLL